MKVRCNYCGHVLDVPANNASFFSQGCPVCHQFCGFAAVNTLNGYQRGWIIAGSVLGGFFLLLIIASLIVGTIVSDSEDSSSYDSSLDDRELSGKALMAKEYIDHLPEGQKNAILYGYGDRDDRANAMANLMKSGNLQGAAEYLSK